MKKILFVICILFIVAIGGWALLFMTDNSENEAPSDTSTTSEQTNDNLTNTAAESEETTTNVIMTNMLFTPSQITIEQGETVTWTNNDSVDHTVTADTGNGPKSETIKPGSTYHYTFNEVGSFQYHCEFHSAMHGTVVVR